ncbi:hypothetical protein Ppa06_62270 [Planomonospora parontospora subsp. parontospora]|uniref:Secreted protein n=2 Tax=Planomonospora parontospora TaxID=58119 RepID=A0AA37F2H0_9ACTN|nr:hypothetical protein [Planomonospora parontospora]GGK49140.1 hypothetical protein GCM10010126_05910 [Planomonospora parontospora]GII12429.1 hypothetical protein Ppa06_62270 [Planomonospora parontospora subsp. parontospora]
MTSAPPRPAPPAPAAPPPPPVSSGASGGGVPAVPDRTGRALLPRGVPGRIRLITAVSVLALAVLFGTLFTAAQSVRDGLDVIGHDAGPQVVATADLYFALSDMDAQVANVLLIGGEHRLGKGRARALEVYERRRSDAGRAVLQSSALAGGDPAERRTVQAVLDGLGRYERLAARALLLDEQAGHPAGPPPRPVLEVYREATDLMRLELLPMAYNLTLESGTVVRRAHQERTLAVRAGQVLTGVAGVAALCCLVWLQVFLARRFRRVFNPALLVATAIAGMYALTGVTVLGQEADVLRAAKRDGFDSVLTLARARAVGSSMHGDQSRWLLDPERADTYEQTYLDKSQSVLYTPAGDLAAYQSAVKAAVDGDRAAFLGLVGQEAARTNLPGSGPAVAAVLARYRDFQQADRTMREAGPRRAVEQRMGRLETAFGEYDAALLRLAELHRVAFDRQIRNGEERIGELWFLLPIAMASTAVMILAGVRPRLSEYR